MIRTFLTCAISILPAAAFAETQLERLERLSEEMSAIMPQMMANEIEAQGGDGSALRDVASAMPQWDDAMRAAGECVLARYSDISGRAGVDAMLDKMDGVMAEMATMEMTEFAESDMSDVLLPEGVSFEESAAITQECGMIELQMDAMQNSGFMEAMLTAGATVQN